MYLRISKQNRRRSNYSTQLELKPLAFSSANLITFQKGCGAKAAFGTLSKLAFSQKSKAIKDSKDYFGIESAKKHSFSILLITNGLRFWNLMEF